MIRDFFIRQAVIARLESGPLATHLPLLASSLRDLGYATKTVRRYLRNADRYARWLMKAGVSLATAGAEELSAYRRSAASNQRRDRTGTSGLERVTELLRPAGVLNHVRRGPADDWLDAYAAHLRNVRGLSAASCEAYLRNATHLVTELFPQTRTAHRNGEETIAVPARAPLGGSQSAATTREIKRQSVLNKEEVFRQVKTLQASGLKITQIARRLGYNRRRFYGWAQISELPPRNRMQPREGSVGAFLDYLRRRWQEGHRNGKRLFDEIQARGYSGAYKTLAKVLAPWRHADAWAEWPEQASGSLVATAEGKAKRRTRLATFDPKK